LVLKNKIIRNMSTPESRKFWEEVEKSAAETALWLAWKKAGIELNPYVYETYKGYGIRHAPRKINSK